MHQVEIATISKALKSILLPSVVVSTFSVLWKFDTRILAEKPYKHRSRSSLSISSLVESRKVIAHDLCEMTQNPRQIIEPRGYVAQTSTPEMDYTREAAV